MRGHVLLGRPAAIKVLLPALSEHQDLVMRFSMKRERPLRSGIPGTSRL
jgi:hypothetical protein